MEPDYKNRGDENLFRAKCIDETHMKGMWFDGDILHDGVTGKCYIHIEDDCLNESDKVGEEGFLQFIAYEVDPDTICQYKGFQDCNGKKIFDGDICKYYNQIDKGGIAIIRDDCAEWICGKIRQTNNITPLFYLKCSEEWEILGNVFDNPELVDIFKTQI